MNQQKFVNQDQNIVEDFSNPNTATKIFLNTTENEILNTKCYIVYLRIKTIAYALLLMLTMVLTQNLFGSLSLIIFTDDSQQPAEVLTKK